MISITQVRTGRDAATPDPDNPMRMTMNPISSDDKYKLGADLHDHPRQGDPSERDMSQKSAHDRVNARNLYPSTGDFVHMNQTGKPMFLKNTAWTILEVYRVNKIDHLSVVTPGSKSIGDVPSDLHDVVVDH